MGSRPQLWGLPASLPRAAGSLAGLVSPSTPVPPPWPPLAVTGVHGAHWGSPVPRCSAVALGQLGLPAQVSRVLAGCRWVVTSTELLSWEGGGG